tara:strand:+ start:4090 stop:4566 length:477 start_codon:yes stop_codon:yes gene_type:complete
VNIREVKKTDNLELSTLLKKILIEMGVPKKGTAFEDPEIDSIYQTYESPRSKYFIVEEDGIIKGGAGISQLKNEAFEICELQKMYFDSSIRGKGIGSIMIEKCLEFAKKSKFTLCYIETMPNMLDAQNLYLKYGFEYIDSPMGNTGHSACPIWMTKSL